MVDGSKQELPVVPLVLILMAGMPGTGKSTLAQALGGELGFPVIDKDVILSALLEGGIPESSAQPAAYRVMFDLGEKLLQQGFAIVLDSPAGLPESVIAAQSVCRRVSARLIPVLCLAEQDVRNERVATRTSLSSQPVGISKTLGNARERFPHMPVDTLEVDTMKRLDIVVRDAMAAIQARLTALS